MTKKPLLILTGPTAVGKTKLSIELAKKVNGEIISADSCQVYRHMDIGSAKITKAEMEDVPHYLIDILEPSEECNVFTFQKLARECIEDIHSRGKVPVIAGGTGFYIQALLYQVDFTEKEDDGVLRRSLEALALEKGAEFLHSMLKEFDPVSAELIHPNNQKRVIRAIEYYRLTGMPISSHNETERNKESAYDSRYFVLTDERSRLYEQIDARVDLMLSKGLVDEVRSLQALGCTEDMQSMHSLGYRQILACLNGAYPLEEAVYRIKRDTRHFAKRQLTWFNREKDVIWVSKPEFGYDKKKILEFLLSRSEAVLQTGAITS